MNPNRLALAYLAVWTGVLGLVVALASREFVLRLSARLTGTPVAGGGEPLLAASVALGLLSWPGILALARTLFVPRRLPAFQVRDEPVGTAVVVLPALNEEQAIAQVVRDFLAAPEVGGVIVVDNGSTDLTAAMAASAGATVVSERARGYGHACRRALAEGLRSGHSVVVLCEADGTFRAADLQKFLSYLHHADLVVGSRTHGTLVNSDSQLNSLLALGNLFVAKLLQLRYWDWAVGGRVRLTDVGCTYRAVRAAALQRILPAMDVGGNHFGPHMVMVSLEHGLRVVEVPVTFWKRVGISKGGNASWRSAVALGLVMIWHILTGRIRRSPDPAAYDPERVGHAVLR